MLDLFVDESVAEDTPFRVVKEKAFSLLASENFPLVSGYMRHVQFDKTAYEWSYGKLQRKFKLNLRHLFCISMLADY